MLVLWSLNSSHTQIFASATARAVVCLACQDLSVTCEAPEATDSMCDLCFLVYFLPILSLAVFQFRLSCVLYAPLLCHCFLFVLFLQYLPVKSVLSSFCFPVCHVHPSRSFLCSIVKPTCPCLGVSLSATSLPALYWHPLSHVHFVQFASPLSCLIYSCSAPLCFHFTYYPLFIYNIYNIQSVYIQCLSVPLSLGGVPAHLSSCFPGFVVS